MKDTYTVDQSLLLQIAAYLNLVKEGLLSPDGRVREAKTLLDKIGDVLAQTNEEENDE